MFTVCILRHSVGCVCAAYIIGSIGIAKHINRTQDSSLHSVSIGISVEKLPLFVDLNEPTSMQAFMVRGLENILFGCHSVRYSIMLSNKIEMLKIAAKCVN